MKEKLLKNVELRIRNNELKNKKELEEHLVEYKYRGVLTKMEVDSLVGELSKLFDVESKKVKNSKRITRTPQNRFF